MGRSLDIILGVQDQVGPGFDQATRKLLQQRDKFDANWKRRGDMDLFREWRRQIKETELSQHQAFANSRIGPNPSQDIVQTAVQLGGIVAAVRGGLTLVAGTTAAIKGDWAKVNELMGRLPLGLGEIWKLGGELRQVFGGTADEARRLAVYTEATAKRGMALETFQGIGKRLRSDREHVLNDTFRIAMSNPFDSARAELKEQSRLRIRETFEDMSKAMAAAKVAFGPASWQQIGDISQSGNALIEAEKQRLKAMLGRIGYAQLGSVADRFNAANDRRKAIQQQLADAEWERSHEAIEMRNRRIGRARGMAEAFFGKDQGRYFGTVEGGPDITARYRGIGMAAEMDAERRRQRDAEDMKKKMDKAVGALEKLENTVKTILGPFASSFTIATP